MLQDQESPAATAQGVGFVEQVQSSGGSSLRFATPAEEGTLNGSSIDPTQVTPNANGSFTFGAPQADPNGLVNQLNVNGSFGTAGVTVTNPTTGASATINLDNGSSTTLQEGRSVATGAPNEQAVTTQANGQIDDAIIGDGADVSVNNATLTFAPDTSASVTGTGDTLGLAADGSVSLVASGASLTVTGTGTIALDASGQTLNTSGGGDTISVASGATSDLIQADGATIGASDISASDLAGSNDIVTLSGTGSDLGIFGSGNTVRRSRTDRSRDTGSRATLPRQLGRSRSVGRLTGVSQLCVGVGNNCTLKRVLAQSNA